MDIHEVAKNDLKNIPRVPREEINTVRPSGLTPLQTIICAERPEWGVLLLAKGADPNYPFFDGTPPLIVAAVRKYSELVKGMVSCGANTEERWDGLTPLLHCCFIDDTDAAKLLFEVGCDPFATDDLGHNALHVAASRGNFELCSTFVGKYAGLLYSQNVEGKTAYDLLCDDSSRDEIIALFNGKTRPGLSVKACR